MYCGCLGQEVSVSVSHVVSVSTVSFLTPFQLYAREVGIVLSALAAVRTVSCRQDEALLKTLPKLEEMVDGGVPKGNSRGALFNNHHPTVVAKGIFAFESLCLTHF